ncbi:MAG: MotA/TolQ/ExbB proton channel family protein [Chitinivibrionales bacterium]|nr:MotA/TolQ/ExbB proton channel family protein [Chitinivibrionales bacterium]MBD3395128.1 MotA/TolQ/ExbB proton channel family protein [Chitinivibrionales bacterium]
MSFFAKFFHSFSASEPGFIFMWILLVVGIFGVAVAIERLYFLLTRQGFRVEQFVREILMHVQNDDFEGAHKLCQSAGKMALAQVLKAGLDEAKHGASHIRNSIDEAMLKVIPQLEKRTAYLATIGNVATLLGLMGTIYGLILSFAAVGKPGIDAAEKSTLLASGIAAAMNTTFSGLAVAIPSIILYALFRSKTQRIIDEIDEHSLRFTNAVIEKTYKTQKYHISASELKEGIGLHVTAKRVKVFTDNKLIKEIEI